ncbi:MAG: AAA family ATPase [Planctomycetaceae bacterium]
MTFLKSLRLTRFLSFPPDSPVIELTPLNVMIGPNGSGKSNVIEAIELLRATPTGFANAIRDGGGASEWLWKGESSVYPAEIEAVVCGNRDFRDLRYRLQFHSSNYRTEVIDEALEEAEKRHPNEKDVYFFYRFQRGRPVLNVQVTPRAGVSRDGREERGLRREELIPDESVLSQRKGSDTYPEITWLGKQFETIQTFREWTFGRYSAVRKPQPAHLPGHALSDDCTNLGLFLNGLEHSGVIPEFNRLLRRFLPRYQRFSTRIVGGNVQLHLHEEGLATPVSATRLSDGTIRFMALLAVLLNPDPPPLICIEEPELGLHPDAVSLLAELLVSASRRTQLIVTTHSDVLISGLSEDANSVLVCDYAGGTQLERVDPEKLKHFLSKYRLGEIWRIGELGGNP